MSDSVVQELGRLLMRGVVGIDLECKRLLNGVEYGLCNVKRQFREDVAEGFYPDAPKRKLTEEPATAWLLAKRLPHGLVVRPEEPYPVNRRKKCDLVVVLKGGVAVWVEVKFSWKNWFECINGYKTNSDFIFQDYLLGNHHSHSAAGDFVKLIDLAPASAYLGVLLIGFDSTDAPMNQDIENLEKQAVGVGWLRDDPQRWKDRRDPTGRCHINCWFWRHSPRAQSC